jgi:hypothetical protein
MQQNTVLLRKNKGLDFIKTTVAINNRNCYIIALFIRCCNNNTTLDLCLKPWVDQKSHSGELG